MPTTLWTPVKTWLEGEKVRANEIVEQVSDNITWLYERNIDVAQVSGISDYTVTNTSFENIGVLQCQINKSRIESLLRVTFCGTGYHSTNGQQVYFDVLVDNSWYLSSGNSTPNADGILFYEHYGAGFPQTWMFDLVFPDIPQGVHQFNLQWKVDAGTGSLNTTNSIAQFAIEEYGLSNVTDI